MPAPSLPALPTMGTAGASGVVTVLPVKTPEPEPRAPERYLRAMLIVCIHEVFALVCLHRSGQMRIISFIIDGLVQCCTLSGT
ncbi:hypothetical protein Bpro_0410 [Polaromonas sp. JS666]|nr:hypothetical protein Bpro_0410 [Polaromonas sp. JS666]